MWFQGLRLFLYHNSERTSPGLCSALGLSTECVVPCHSFVPYPLAVFCTMVQMVQEIFPTGSKDRGSLFWQKRTKKNSFLSKNYALPFAFWAKVLALLHFIYQYSLRHYCNCAKVSAKTLLSLVSVALGGLKKTYLYMFSHTHTGFFWVFLSYHIDLRQIL